MGYPFIFADVAYWLIGIIGRWLLADLISGNIIFSLTFRSASLALFLLTAFGQALSPVALCIRTNHPDRYQVIKRELLLSLLFTMLAVAGGMSFFSGETISMMMRAEYGASELLSCDSLFQNYSSGKRGNHSERYFS